MPQAGQPVSLKSPEASDASGRAARQEIKVSDASGPDSTVVGFNCRGARYVHITVSLPDAGTALDWSLWLYDEVSGKWCLDSRPGTAGVVSIAAASTDNPQYNIIEIAGVSRVWIQLANLTGTFTEGASVWVSGSHDA